MRLSLAEIRANAMKFSAEWADASSERAEAQTFWNELFAVFGLKRRLVATFEEKVKNLKKAYSRIDVFYAGVMLGEHKSKGEDLSAAKSQAFDYVQSLSREGRDGEAPQYIVVSDFETIAVYDLDGKDPGEPIARFKTAKLHENIRHLSFLSGYTTRPVDPEDPINIDAVEVLGQLHDALEKGGYSGHKLERFLVRVLFCLFADDTSIFDNEEFKVLVNSSRSDGSDLGSLLARFFKVLDTDKKDRPAKLPEDLKDLPYVNGELFAEDLGFADFDTPMRKALIECCKFKWSKISPAVFGSLFQSIMAGEEGRRRRRQIGAHYTSERDIMKLVRSLFLDDLQAELAVAGKDRRKLEAFHNKLASLRFLDPACGCGNFLVITYRELRLLELETLMRLHGGKIDTERLLLDSLLKVDVDQMHGIEIEEWPARIAEVAMWLIDHQMNQNVGEAFGQPVLRLPLKKSAKIAVANALRTDWNEILPAARCSFVLGNPPFVGKKEQNAAQKADFAIVWSDVTGSGVLDYVTCWHRKAAKYIKGNQASVAFVSTNSICQGEQVGVVWKELLTVCQMSIRFAHNTFAWMSEARGRAHVHVVIIGFGRAVAKPVLTDYSDDEDHPTRTEVTHISPYLTEGPDVFIVNRSRPLVAVKELSYGSFALDDGNFTLTESEAAVLLSEEPAARPFVRLFIGAEELIHNVKRYCLWLKDVTPSELRAMPMVLARVEAVRVWRSGRDRQTTRELAETPAVFAEIRQPASTYLAIPTASGERRKYIPMAYMPPEVIASNQVYVLSDATLYHFGILTSEMHMAWVRRVCGRLKSDFRYSNKLVYNNFPWPQTATDRQKSAVEVAAQSVLDARGLFHDQTLADLYDPLAMPKLLHDAHKDLDRAVDKCYRAAPFTSERQRVEFLFDLYQKLTSPLTAAPTRSRGSRRA